ncbi:MAG: helix-turn-helix transcriptional regulator [Bacteroidota bacterium]
MKGNHLGEFEEIVLLTVAILYDEAYGVAVREEIERRMDRKVSLGAMHATLVRLEEKGLLRSRLGEATSKRGGKRKRHFQVTRIGQEALRATRAVREDLWRDVPGAAFN